MFAIDLTRAEPSELPFPHFVCAGCIDVGTAERLLCWLEGDAPWRVFSDDFYEFDGVNLRDADLGDGLGVLVSDSFLDGVRRELERVFAARLGQRAGIAAQRLLPGRDIGVHTDFGPQGQTHRLVLQLNRGWAVDQGGLLMLFDEERPERLTDRHCLYSPEHRSAVGFQISERSYHAVSRVRAGARYSLCISFSDHD
jgi:hypothetical protein